MKISETAVYSAVNEYIDSELMPMMSVMGQLEQFTFGITLGLFRRKVQSMFKKVTESKAMQFLDVVDEHGNFDAETAYLAATDALKNIGHIEVGGIRFTTNDLDKLYAIMQRYA